MGCTSSKENTNPPTTTITDNNQQLINEHFRKWLKSNRPKVDEYVLNDIKSTIKPSNDIDDYRRILSKSLDLLSERSDIKTINKLNKLVQKEVSLASPKKVAYTIDVLKRTAEKLHHGQLILDNDQQPTTTTNGEVTNNTKTVENRHGQTSSGEPGIPLKEALEQARILFYKGKQAAIFANPNGGYDVRIIDENDDVLKQNGNLLRSIIVTEVKMCPKPSPSLPTNSTQHTVPLPPPPSKLLNEHEIGDDFRRSIDAALKGLEAIYHTSSGRSSEHAQDIHINKSEDNIIHHETTNQTEIRNSIPLNEDIEDREKYQLKENLSINQPSSYSVDLTSPIQNEESILLPSLSQEKVQSDESTHLTQTDLSNEILSTSFDKIKEEPSIKNNESTSISQIIEEHNKTLPESSLTPVVAPIDMNITVKSPSHNVTYTEIIHSESHDGEQSRRFMTESYNELPSKDDEQTTTLKVVTKSEFSNHPSLGEKIMEQSVQVITVKVRNETITTTNPSQTSDSEITDEK